MPYTLFTINMIFFFRIFFVENSFDRCDWWSVLGRLDFMFDQVSSMVSIGNILQMGIGYFDSAGRNAK